MTVITDIQERQSLIAKEGNNSLDETDQLLHAIGEIATNQIECIKGQLVCEGLATEQTHVVLWLEGRQIPSELCNIVSQFDGEIELPRKLNSRENQIKITI